MADRRAQTLTETIDTIAYRLVLLCLGGMAAMLATVALYLAKSAMGIDLMDGPSPLHGLFF
jgi:hypothetical protein